LSESTSIDEVYFCGGDHPNGHYSYQNNSVEEEVNYISNKGRQCGFSNNNYHNNMHRGWRGNRNEDFGWKQDASPSNRQPPFQ